MKCLGNTWVYAMATGFIDPNTPTRAPHMNNTYGMHHVVAFGDDDNMDDDIDKDSESEDDKDLDDDTDEE